MNGVTDGVRHEIGAFLAAGHGPAVGLAVLAALFFAGAAVLQHRAVSATAGGSTRPGPVSPAPARSDEPRTLTLRDLPALVRRRGWLLGLVLAGSGIGLHAVALVMAPLVVVQPVGVLAVPIAVLLTAGLARRAPGRGVLVGTGAALVGVVLFVSTAAGHAVSSPPAGWVTFVAVLVTAGVVAALAGFAGLRTGPTRCVAFAVAGAVAAGLVAALMRVVAEILRGGQVGVFDPDVLAVALAMAGAGLGGIWLVQQAFSSGPPEVVVACLTVVDPIVAVLLGAVLLGEGTATAPSTWALMVGAAVLATAGVLGLARHHPDAAARRAGAPAPPDPAGHPGHAEPPVRSPRRGRALSSSHAP